MYICVYVCMCINFFLQVLTQLDNKFIVCLLYHKDKGDSFNEPNSKVLVLFDQHAVHERIRLERLVNGN